MVNNLKKLIIFTMLSAIAFVSTGKDMRQNDDLYELPKQCDFNEVGNNDSNEFDCSPKLKNRFTSEFVGLIINTPETVLWPEKVGSNEHQNSFDDSYENPYMFMVAGLAYVPDSTLGLAGDVAYHVSIVAVNQKTAESYIGRMIKVGYSGDDPDDVFDFDAGEEATQEFDMVRKTYFNIDLVSNAGLPIEEATYSVYAILGDYKSNVMTVKTSIKK